jgi:hypothetical protein
LTLARDADVELLPAWLETAITDEPWRAVTGAVVDRVSRELVARAVLLGLPVAALGERPRPSVAGNGALAGLPLRATCVNGQRAPASIQDLVVVDLSALWAGPLCASVLAAAGATVLKVEAVRRPDGARRGPEAFFRLLNAGKRSVRLDLAREHGRRRLRALLADADVVVESSRPRALEHMDIDARRHLGAQRTRVWISITGHGRSGAGSNRVAFGDDAAVAGGLVAWEDGEPRFCADAVADPATGLVAAAGSLAALEQGGSWLLDVAMAGVTAHLAGPTLPVPRQLVVNAPRARPEPG